MSTTTIRLPEELKVRVVAAAERAGTTAHNFILETFLAKAEQAKQAALPADFHAVAELRYANIAVTGKTISWETMRHYLEERVADKPAKRPVCKKLAR
jgi:predicted DNA-binding protein